MIELCADVGDVSGQGVERRFDQFKLAGFVFVARQLGPVGIAGVRARHDQRAVAAGPGAWIVERIRAARDISAQQQLGAKQRGRGAEQQIAQVFIELFTRLERHVNLATGIIQPHGLGVVAKFPIEMLLADQVKNGRLQVGVRNDRAGGDLAAIDLDAADAAAADQNLLHVAFDPHVDAVFQQFLVHQLDQPVGATLEREHALGHEI